MARKFKLDRKFKLGEEVLYQNQKYRVVEFGAAHFLHKVILKNNMGGRVIVQEKEVQKLT